MTETEPQVPTGRQAIFIVFVSFFLIIAVEFFVWQAGISDRKESLLAEALIIVPSLIYSRKKGFPIRDLFRIHWPGRRIIAASFMIGSGVLVLSDGFERLASLILPESEALEALQEQLQKSFSAQSGHDFFLIIVSIIFIAGIAEEMLFRGFLLRALEHHMDVTKAVMTSAFIFSFFHYIWIIWPWAFIQILILGVILGVVAWKSNSIFPAAVIHKVNNTPTLLLLQTKDTPIAWYEWHGQVAPWMIIIAGGLTWYGFKNLYRLTVEEDDSQTSSTFENSNVWHDQSE